MDLVSAKLFLQQLDQSENPSFAYRCFQDDKSAVKNPSLTCMRYGKLEDLQDEFIRLNMMGSGIFYTVNRTNGQGFKKEDVISVRAVFADLDGSPLEPAQKFKLPPQIVVESSQGRFHTFWIIDKNQPLALPLFEPVQSKIAELFHSDPSVKDLGRVMRLPGMYHKKNPLKPFLTTIISTHNTPSSYSATEILDAFGIAKTGKQKTLPISIPQGQRDTRLMSFAGQMRRAGASEQSILAALTVENTRCIPPLEEVELIRIANSVSKYSPVEGDFVRDKDGKIYPNSQANIRTALDKLNVRVSYDLFSEKYLLQRGDNPPEHMEDKNVDRLWLEGDEAFRFRPTFEFFDKVIKDIAYTKNKFHPVRDYLKSLRAWDGTPRIDSWLINYGGAEDSEYVRTVGRLVLIAAVRRIMQPGAKFDEMLVLISGTQGTEKSSAVEALCPNEDWFSDNLPLDAESKLVIEQTQGKWVIEASDLSGMRKSAVEHLKSFLSRKVDTARMSYARFTTERARQFIIIGTTNSEEFLRDATNRRYWPVKIGKFQISKLKAALNQIWAEASKYEAEGESIRLPERLWPIAEIHQEQRRHEDPWETQVRECVGDVNGRILGEDVWKIVGMFDRARRTQADSIRLTDAMHKLGFERAQIRGNKTVSRGFHRGTEEERKERILITIDDGQPKAAIVPKNYTPEWETAAPDKKEVL